MNGEVGIREEGLWALPIENSNVVRHLTLVSLLLRLCQMILAHLDEIEYSMGPYQPAPDLSLNIMKEAVKDNPEMLDAVVRFLKFLSKPDNVSLICVENGGVLGAVKNSYVIHNLLMALSEINFRLVQKLVGHLDSRMNTLIN